MAGFQTTVKLGRARSEISLSATLEMPESLLVGNMKVQARVQNVAGEEFLRVRRRNKPRFVLNFDKVTESFVQKIESLLYISDAPLSLYWADDRKVYSDRYTLLTTTTLKLTSTPMTLLGRDYVAAGGGHTDIIGIDGVFTTYDSGGAQGGTNYFTSGSYNATTRVVTLGSSPGAAGTVVYANWKYKGALVIPPEKLEIRHSGGNIESALPLWDVTMNLEGA